MRPRRARLRSAGVGLGFDPGREEAELRAYLGDTYDHARLRNWESQLDEEYAAVADEQRFYRASVGYLYNLTAFAISGTKAPYLAELTRRCSPGTRLLDYGCGIGSDGLLLLEAGYRVEFADFDNPSVEYLRWRLRRRGLDAPIHDLDGVVPDGFDAAYAFDVIEHVPDPFAFLAELEPRAGLIVVNFLEAAPDEPGLHHDLPLPALLRHVAERRLVSYRIYHGRSHLVAYSPSPGGVGRRLVAKARLAAGRLRRALLG